MTSSNGGDGDGHRSSPIMNRVQGQSLTRRAQARERRESGERPGGSSSRQPRTIKPHTAKEVSRRTFDRHVKKTANRTIDRVEAGFAHGSGRSARVTGAGGMKERASAQVRKKLRVRKPKIQE